MSVERRFTLVPRLEAMPALVSMAQRLPGKLAVLAVFALGLALHGRPWWAEMIAILAALTLWPSQRRPLIVVAGVAWLFRHASFQWVALHNYSRSCGAFDRIEGRWLEHGALLAALLACLGFHALVRRRGNARCCGIRLRCWSPCTWSWLGSPPRRRSTPGFACACSRS
jgi:hypothetical protein